MQHKNSPEVAIFHHVSAEESDASEVDEPEELPRKLRTSSEVKELGCRAKRSSAAKGAVEGKAGKGARV